MPLLSLPAQSQMSPGMMNYGHPASDSANMVKKWSVSKYSGISASYSFYNGGSMSGISVPIGIQVNRRLNNNLYAFAGVSVAPTFYNFNSSFANTDINKNNSVSRFNSNGLGMYSRVEAGLMYVNDARTFSISGSIGVSRGSYPYYPNGGRTFSSQRQHPTSGFSQ